MKQVFFVGYNDIELVGEIYSPDFAKKLPAIILSHEFGLSMISTVRYAKQLYKAGYHVFIFDFAGSGAGKSRGRASTQMSVFTEKEDLNAVFEYVKTRAFVDPCHIILGGASQGGLVTALFAAEHKDEVEKMFLYYPAFCIPDDARRGCIIGTTVDTKNIPQDFRAMGYVHLGPKYVKDAEKLSPWKEIETYDKPVLLCHGTTDSIVNIEYTRQAFARYPNASLKEISNANHCFVMPWTVRKAVNETIEFLQKSENH